MYYGHAAHILPPDLATHAGPGSGSLRNSAHGVPLCTLAQQRTVAGVRSYMTGDHPEADSRTGFKLRLAERFINGARRGSLGYSK